MKSASGYTCGGVNGKQEGKAAMRVKVVME